MPIIIGDIVVTGALLHTVDDMLGEALQQATVSQLINSAHQTITRAKNVLTRGVADRVVGQPVGQGPQEVEITPDNAMDLIKQSVALILALGARANNNGEPIFPFIGPAGSPQVIVTAEAIVEAHTILYMAQDELASIAVDNSQKEPREIIVKVRGW